MRSIMTTSAPSSAESRSVVASTPISSTRGGRSVGGAQTTTLAPIRVSSQMFERATRECVMSPAIATRRPSSFPKRRRIVRASSRAWVGCSCAPSPALTTPARRLRARKCGTPGQLWRMTIRSGAIAWRLRAVSRRDSPFSTELPLAAKESASAESHFSAVSKEKRVRVEDSKKRLTTIRPRSAGTFLICLSPIGRMDSAVSRINAISPAERSSVPSRSLERREVGVNLSGGSLEDPDLVGAVGLLEHDLDDFPLGGGHALSDVVGLDRDLAVPPVDQDRETDHPGPPEVDQPVQRRPNGAAGVEDVVAEDDGPAVQVEVDLGLLQERLRRHKGQVVAVERDVERADREGLLDELSQGRREPRRE